MHIPDKHNYSTQHQIQPILLPQQNIEFEHNNYIGNKTVSPPPNFISFDNEKSVFIANNNELNPILINGQNAIHHAHNVVTKKPKKRIVLEVLSVVYGENNQPVFFLLLYFLK